MLCGEITAEIERHAPLWAQASWDLSGLQVASSRERAATLAVFLDPTPQRIAQALALGADFLLSHHPLTLKPKLPNRLDAWREALRLLLAADVPLYASHTSLDVNPAGPAGWLGRALGIGAPEPLERLPESELGYGGIGDLPRAEAAGAFCQRVMRLTGARFATLSGPLAPDPIKRVAWCGGSGASLAARAAEMGAQIYISGDIKYHAALEAEMTVLDIGHHGYEEKMMAEFARLLALSLPEMRVIFISSESPFREIRAGGGSMCNE